MVIYQLIKCQAVIFSVRHLIGFMRGICVNFIIICLWFSFWRQYLLVLCMCAVTPYWEVGRRLAIHLLTSLR